MVQRTREEEEEEIEEVATARLAAAEETSVHAAVAAVLFSRWDVEGFPLWKGCFVKHGGTSRLALRW